MLLKKETLLTYIASLSEYKIKALCETPSSRKEVFVFLRELGEVQRFLF